MLAESSGPISGKVSILGLHATTGGKDQEPRHAGCESHLAEGKVVGIGPDVGKVLAIELKLGAFRCDEPFGGLRAAMGRGHGASHEQCRSQSRLELHL